MPINVSTALLGQLASGSEFREKLGHVRDSADTLKAKNGAGSDFLGWLDLPESMQSALPTILETAKHIRECSDIVLVIGIGGSYLGAKAAIDFLRSPMYNMLPKSTPDIHFLGTSLSSSALCDVLSLCEDKEVSAIMVSKSGSTLESGLAFRFVRQMLKEKYGDEYGKRIYVVTDPDSGMLKQMADSEGYTVFPIPKDVGGRYSVLSAAGLLPIAIADVDVSEILHGARDAKAQFFDSENHYNACHNYVAVRHLLNEFGKKVELFVSYSPTLTMFTEWLKQLFGESEGKRDKGIYPSSATFPADLHSIGQFIQEGTPLLFETHLHVTKDSKPLVLYRSSEPDGLEYMDGKTLGDIEKTVFRAVIMAHSSGGTPQITIEISERNEYNLGYLFYFFQLACAISGYTLGVNPFDQPGVEEYKKNIYALLGKSEQGDR